MRKKKITSISEFFKDISKNTNESLTLSKDQWQDLERFCFQNDLLNIEFIGNAITDGIFICDKEGFILYVNETNQRLTGISYEQCVGKNISEFTDDEDDNRIQNVIIRHVLKTKTPYSSIVVPPNTGIQMLEIGAPILDDSDNLLGCLVIDRDISELTAITEELRESETKIAHYQAANHHNIQVIDQLNKQHKMLMQNFTDSIESNDPKMVQIYAMAYQAAQTDVTTLLLGETGTGKEIIANYIYEHSPRSAQPFIKVNCAAIPEHLLESEMFGYVKGAFTGASSSGKAGMFELADNGTLFLDEIGELPMDFQAKLLRAIQQQEICRVGDTKTIKLNIRIIAATNRNLPEMIAAGKFREDLFYRLNIFPINIPPLRERKEDITAFTNHFLASFNKKYKKNIILAPNVLRGMYSYQWPGNIRELENVLERWVVIYEPYTTLYWDMVESYFYNDPSNQQSSTFTDKSLKELLADYEKEILTWASEQYGTTRAMAAALHVDHSTIVRKAQALGISLGKRSNIM